MKTINKIITIFVGGLFIFSGLIKLNDPVGTAIKLEEYFEVFATDFASFFHLFIPFSLPIAVFIVVLEVLLGISLLINFRKKDTIKALFGLIIFFTFLTFYSAYFNKVTDCGCFGDAIPLDPWESFYKDIILSILIITLLIQLKKFENTTSISTKTIMISSLVFSLFLGIYAIRHLPFIDFRPYKVGNNIPQNMQPMAPCKYEYIMEKDGKEYKFDTYPSDPSYKYKDMKTVNEKECLPKITDYNLTDDNGNDFTEQSFKGHQLIIVINKSIKSDKESIKEINKLIDNLNGKIGTMLFTSDSEIDAYRHDVQLAVPFYYVDATVLKAIIRSNPGVLLFSNGTVKGKWHFNDIPDYEKIMRLIN